MKKRPKLRKILRGLAIAAVLLLLFVQFGLGFTVKHAAQTLGSTLLGCDIAIESCRLRPLTGVVDMRGVVVGPPEGFDANLFEMERLRVDYAPFSVFGSGPMTIHELVVTNALVSYELKGLDSNVSAVMQRLGGGDKAAEETAEEPPPPAAEGGKKVVIEHFAFVGAKVRAAFWDGKGVKPPLPSIELRDIGKKTGGATALEALGQIVGSIGRGVIGLVADLGGAVVDAAAAVGGAALEGAAAVGGAIGDAAAAVGGAIGGLFGGD